MAQKYYVFSGLGADERVFKNLSFSDAEVEHIQWIPPLATETLAQYAQRIVQRITAPRPMLVGLSFGGMVAVEIAKILPVEKVILISSAKTRDELPLSYRFLGKLHLHKFLPYSLMQRANAFTYWLFGVDTSEDKALLKSILEETPTSFLRWAISAIIGWQNTEIPTNFIHYHGDNDHILPFRYIKNAQRVVGGGHSMVLSLCKI